MEVPNRLIRATAGKLCCTTSFKRIERYHYLIAGLLARLPQGFHVASGRYDEEIAS